MHVFPVEEVLAFELWKDPLEDPGIRVFHYVHLSWINDGIFTNLGEKP